jgi:hypothetical protein
MRECVGSALNAHITPCGGLRCMHSIQSDRTASAEQVKVPTGTRAGITGVRHGTSLNTIPLARFAIRTAVVMKSAVFWDITPCSPLKAYRRFGVLYRMHLQIRI